MKLALIGYGKMGKAIEEMAEQTGHQVVGRLGRDSAWDDSGIQGADAAVDFSVGSAVPGNVEKAVQAGVPIVVGTTGWQDSLDQVRKTVERGGGACIHSSNFSLGVQALFYVSRIAAQLMSRLGEYSPYLSEVHHAEKLDAPSGTALKLQSLVEEVYGCEIPVASLRSGHFPGTHELGFDSEPDTLRLVHTARSRLGFARGVLFACRWIQGKQGFFQLEEVLFND